jgi:hypothetical protein
MSGTGANEAPEENREPIPDILHSAYLEGPFTRCSACGTELPDGRFPYQIQKTWRGREVVFEMALCVRCAEGCMSQFSRESLERMQRFFQERFRGPVEGIDACHFCGTPIGEDSEYEIGASCLGAQLLGPPVVACAECNARAQENLSRKTRDAWGDFIRDNFPGVPEELSPERLPVTF